MDSSMTTAGSTSLLCGVREALRNGGVSQLGDRPGLPHLPEAETWLAGGKVLLKVTVAPEERVNAEAIPDRVHGALRSGGFRLACDGDAPAAASPEAALGAGRAVRVVVRH